MSLRPNAPFSNRFPAVTSTAPPSFSALAAAPQQPPSNATHHHNPYQRNHNNNNNNPVRQFEAWDREAQAFRKEAREMDERRAIVAERLADTRRQQSEWQERLHRTSDALGGAHRRRDMLQAERTRLRTALASERDALVECATNIEELGRTEANEKKAYCADLAEGNRELGRLLQKQEDLRLRKLFHPEAVPVLLEHYGAPVEGTEGATAASSLDSRDANAAALEDLTAAAHELREQAAAYRGVVAQRDQLRARLLACRSRALHSTRGTGETGDAQLLTAANLEELEARWGRAASGAMEDAATMGSEEAAPNGVEMPTGDARGAPQPNPSSEPTSARGVLDAPVPVHLQLFYPDDTDESVSTPADGVQAIVDGGYGKLPAAAPKIRAVEESA